MTYAFWISLGIIIYVYFGYPLAVLILSKLTKFRTIHETRDWPNVTLIIATHNEGENIQSKITNSLALDYPPNKFQIIVASDGSTDNTCEIVEKYSKDILLVKSGKHVGKSAIQNIAMKKANGEIIVFSDAQTKYNNDVLRKLVRHFNDPEVGVVTGQVIYVNKNSSDASRSEGLYWAYESCIREAESRLGILVMGSGCILAVRKVLFGELTENTGEDFFLPLKVVGEGHRVVYEKDALAYENVAASRKNLFRTKCRIISKDLKGLFMNRKLLNPLKYPVISISLLSHKLLRWLIPFFLFALLATNLPLLNQPLYRVLIVFQLLFYGCALTGYFSRLKIFSIPFNFCLINLASAVGTIKYLAGKTSGAWSPERG